MGASRGRRQARRTRAATALAVALCAGAVAAPTAAAAPPTILATGFSNVTTETVTLEAKINPQEKATLYHFEYGPEDCSSNPCTSVPSPEEGQINPGANPVAVSFTLEGLDPAGTYHFRVVAKSAGGKAEGPDRAFATYLPSPAFGPCPNDLFRIENPSAASLDYSSANLPDCRAYEQASPPDKNAGDITGIVPLAKASLDGSAIGYLSSAGVPGGVGSQDIPSYLASRGEGTWSTHGMLPPAADGEGAKVLGWTPDFSEVFTKATRRGNPSETELLATPGTGGPPTAIVGYTPGLEPSFAGTTKDGSLLFESPAKLTEAAVSGRSNVYLWDSASEEVSLAGALNDAKAPAKGAFAGPYDWIHGTNSATLSQGGGERGYYTEEERAISTDGSAVYFTEAATGKLYVRLNPTSPQSAISGEECTEAAKACTIEVSASEKADGNGPGGTELGGPRPAAFQAASADGKVAYFSSSEELTEDANTGPEPTELPPPPTIGRSNLEGKEVDGSFMPAHASGIATNSEYIYWADPEANAIGRAKLDGSEAKPNFITGLQSIEDLTVDSKYIYWAEPGSNAIGRATIEGEEVKQGFIEGARKPEGVAVDGSYVYWTNTAADAEGNRGVGRAKLDGTEVKQGFIKLLLPGGELPATPQRVAADGSHIFVTAKGDYIYRFNTDGEQQGEPLEESSLAGKQDIAVDGSHVYWSREGTPPTWASAIGRSNLNLEKVEREFITGPGVEHAQSIAVDASHIYWGNEPPSVSKPGNDLYRFEAEAPAGERLTDLTADTTDTDGAEAQGVPGVSEDGSTVYFTANGDLDGAGKGSAGNCRGRPGSASGECDLYRWSEGGGEAEFVAELEAGGVEVGDAANWAASPRASGGQRFQKTSRVSPNGETLLFRSQLKQTKYPNEGTAEYYRYRAGEGLACVSCDPTLAPPTGPADLGSVSPVQTIPRLPASTASRNLSEDGDRAFFETPDPLVAADTNGQAGCPSAGGLLQQYPSCLDAYEWEAQGTGSCTAEEAIAEGGCLYLLSTGKGTEPALLADASASGEDAFLFSRARLVGQDQDELFDVYDARVGGGLEAQNKGPPPPACESVDACHSGPELPPAEESAASAGFHGPGDPPIKRHRARKHKKQHKHAKKHRRAHPKRRAGR